MTLAFVSRVCAIGTLVLATLGQAAPAASSTPRGANAVQKRWKNEPIAPRVLITSMFSYERAPWVERLKMDTNITVPGLSPLYPNVSCVSDYKICIVTTGEAEINAAVTMTALFFSPLFDFKLTHFLIAGIAGCSPYKATTGAAMFNRFAISVGLQYELDARQIPEGWTTGLWAYGTKQPGIAPTTDIYGTERFEVNTNLLARALDLVKDVTLNDSSAAAAYRQKYDYAPANESPKISSCSGVTSDIYYAGTLLSEAFGNFTSLITDGQGDYCATAQEDTATLEALVRATVAGVADYSRMIILRTCSDFDRGPNPATSNLTAYQAFEADQGGFGIAIENLFVAGFPIVNEIAYDWDAWKDGTPIQENTTFYGDILGTLTK